MVYYKKIILLFCIFSIILLGANFAYAGIHKGPIVPCGLSENSDKTAYNETDPCTLCLLWQTISNIINFISFNLSLPVAALLFIIAGILFVVAGSDEKKVDLAKTIFKNTVIGLVIIFCSWLLIDTLFKTLVDTNVITWAWNSFPTCQ